MPAHAERSTPVRDAVVILQPYVPMYRQAFFERLSESLAEAGLRLVVVAGSPSGEQLERSDAAPPRPWLRHVEQGLVRLPGRTFSYRRMPAGVMDTAAAIVAELAVSSIDTWRLALMNRPHKPALLLWGHVQNYVNDATRLSTLARGVLMRRADGVLAYTASGAEAASSAGVRPNAVFVVQNSANSMRASGVSELRPRAPRYAFIGGLDESKRLRMLVEVADAMARRQQNFSLILAGEGAGRPYLEQAAASRAYLRLVGRVDDEAKAQLASECVALLMPGRVGLVVIDSFNLRLPIITTKWAYHAPEFEYLRDGENCLIVDDRVESVAEAALSLYAQPDLLQRLRERCQADANRYTLTAMVENFTRGVLHSISDRNVGN